MLKEYKICILIICLGLTIISCDSTKRKGNKVHETTRANPTPETNYNKQQFVDVFGFNPSADVRNIYFYSDEIGIDASYWLSFECHDTTAQKIIRKFQLRPAKPAFIYDSSSNVIDSMPNTGGGLEGGLNLNPADWWDTSFINKTVPYCKEKGELYWYLWYNTESHKVYFLTFNT